MLSAEFKKETRRSAFIDEEAEEEGIDFQNDMEEFAQDANIASSLINEVRDLIDDEPGEKDNNSIHQSLYVQQLIEESLEESALITQILEEKKETRLSNLSIKKKYGRKAAVMHLFEQENVISTSPRAILNSIGNISM